MSAAPAPTEQQASIVARREEIKARIAGFDREIRKCQLELAFVQEECPHPDAYTKSLMGRDTLWRCPDCLLTR